MSVLGHCTLESLIMSAEGVRQGDLLISQAKGQSNFPHSPWGIPSKCTRWSVGPVCYRFVLFLRKSMYTSASFYFLGEK